MNKTLKNTLFLSTGILLALLVWSCSDDNIEDITIKMPSACDTLDVSYSSSVKPIIVSRCYSCHSKSTSFGGVTLEEYSNLKIWIDNKRLRGAIKHEEGYAPMPPNGEKLLDCEIQQIEAWINKGAKDN